MPCYEHQLAVLSPFPNKNGKPFYKFTGSVRKYLKLGNPFPQQFKYLPCRQCIGCRLERSRQWATRLLHEERKHANACFLTLTYDDDHVPLDGSLKKVHLQRFFENLRDRMEYHEEPKIKYLGCGEYGEKKARPHYHAILYGPFGVHNLDDRRTEVEPSRSGGRQFTHPHIAAVWEHGLHKFSEFNFETAAYVARYVLKKVSGAKSEAHYGTREPEFQLMSKGLGKGHIEDWVSDVYPADHVVLPGRGEFLPPPYYDRLLEKVDPTLFAQVKAARKEAREEMTQPEQLKQFIIDSLRGEEHRKLVTEQTLIRGIE